MTEQTLETLYANSDDSYYSSTVINVCYYLAETYEGKFKSAAGDSSLIFSGQISAVDTTSMMSGCLVAYGLKTQDFRYCAIRLSGVRRDGSRSCIW